MLIAFTVVAFISAGILAHRAWQYLRVPPETSAVYWLDALEGASPQYVAAQPRRRR